ncbi:phosphoribosyltransferase family protein [Tsukamurella sp. 8F]|uniref:ComF family protein n=1 Tax=unclassified Tsukamurella TaxID=2633480 RepID=UPI0023B973F1|nr:MULTISPECIES: phosphoribosyltransferase family protein [unclassified Tsukamurella]MDF0529046.1 phosphoribosyltransferase family protein [Tsukamurella sp. 8J]MDF0587419.1 phosphoribosyltransferase family protein [Tsukamurella sp. 8F]
MDLAIPKTCGGCGADGVEWCADCERVLHDVPALIRPTVPVGVPVWTLGPYQGPRRSAVLELKERGRGGLAQPLGRAVAHAVLRLAEWGELDGARIALVPAPTTGRAARRRGGDVVTDVCECAARIAEPVARIRVCAALRSVVAEDSVGLGAADRLRNVAGSVRVFRPAALPPPGAAVVIVDDVVTTGATLRESVSVLSRAGVAVAAALTVAAA